MTDLNLDGGVVTGIDIAMSSYKLAWYLYIHDDTKFRSRVKLCNLEGVLSSSTDLWHHKTFLGDPKAALISAACSR